MGEKRHFFCFFSAMTLEILHFFIFFSPILQGNAIHYTTFSLPWQAGGPGAPSEIDMEEKRLLRRPEIGARGIIAEQHFLRFRSVIQRHMIGIAHL